MQPGKPIPMRNGRSQRKAAPIKLQKFIRFDREADEVVVKFKNLPSEKGIRFLVESAFGLDEGKIQRYSGGFSSRLDHRPDEQGGDQLHIFGPHGQKWAYRYNGSRSEPSKYTSPTTNKIRDIVSRTFRIDPSSIEEMVIVNASTRRILLEVTFK
jgi:hypothetical protein